MKTKSVQKKKIDSSLPLPGVICKNEGSDEILETQMKPITKSLFASAIFRVSVTIETLYQIHMYAWITR